MSKENSENSKKQHLSTESYKGVRDFYPEDQAFLQYLLATCRTTANLFGYAEYGASILEPSELYKSKGAENEELVNEQTYSFTDRGGREVTLRPEMTPTVARMVAAKRRELGFPLRLFSIPNLFRYERPQRGRLREHWQLNVDIFGTHAPGADAEVMAVAHALMLAFGASEADFVIKIGSRKFVNVLIEEHSLTGAQGHTLIQLLDRRHKMPQEEFVNSLTNLGITLEDLEGGEAPEEVLKVLEYLKNIGITNAYFEPSIVRGFNYYTGVVFEVFDTHKDNTRALFGGGRYDNLTELFDDEPIPGVGFGMGDVTIENFLSVRNLLPTYIPITKVYIALASKEELLFALSVAQELRIGGIACEVDFGDKKLGDQIKTASKHNIPYLLVIGETEKETNIFTIRTLSSGEEVVLKRGDIINYFTAL